INIDFIPEPCRPEPVTAGIEEATRLRGRARQAREALAHDAQELRRLRREEVAQAGARLREGVEKAAVSPQAKRAKGAVDAWARELAVAEAGQPAALADLAAELAGYTDTWMAVLDRADQQARAQAVAALASLEETLADLSAVAAAIAWLQLSREDGRFD